MANFSLIEGLKNKATTQTLIDEIEKGNASIHEKDGRDLPVLVYAIEWSINDFAEYLVDKGAALNELSFYVSAMMWNANLVELHLDAGLDADSIYLGYTPLNTAISALDRHINSNRYAELLRIVDLLIAHQADVNFQNSDLGQSALHLAAHYGAKTIVTTLLENGADIEVEDKQGYTALHHVCIGDYEAMVIQQLLDAGADMDVQDSIYGQTPLHVAVLFHSFNSVMVLKKLGATAQYIGITKDLPFKNDKPYFDLIFPIGTTALDMAKQLGMDDIKNVLLGRDWDVTFV
jgi:hypothetical protein